MSKFSLDYSTLENTICKKAYKLSEVKDQLESVAFDVVRFKDGDKSADLWQVQSADDGEQYIVSMYDPEEVEAIKTASKKTKSLWQVLLSKTSGAIQVSYKGDPLVRIASEKLGVPQKEAHKIPQYLPSKLSENKKLVKALLNELDESAKNQVLSKYPELL